MEVTLLWDVELPDRRQAAMGGRRPKATLVIDTPERGVERVGIPVAVGRIVRSRHEAGEMSPASRAELLYFVREQSASCARSRIERLVNRRDYSAQELSAKLLDDGYARSVVEASVARAVECGLVNDARYAATFIRTKLSSGWGPRRIEQELRRRGIELSEVMGWPDEFMEDEGEDERAYRVASTRRLSDRNAYEKLVRFLCGRGFGMGVAMRAARRVIDESFTDGS